MSKAAALQRLANREIPGSAACEHWPGGPHDSALRLYRVFCAQSAVVKQKGKREEQTAWLLF